MRLEKQRPNDGWFSPSRVLSAGSLLYSDAPLPGRVLLDHYEQSTILIREDGRQTRVAVAELPGGALDNLDPLTTSPEALPVALVACPVYLVPATTELVTANAMYCRSCGELLRVPGRVGDGR